MKAVPSNGLDQLTFPRARGVFVTATDTHVGKTVVSCVVARLALRAGRRVGVFKPMGSGCRLDQRLGLVSEDAESLSAAGDCTLPLHDICPLRFAEPLAPLVAAQRLKQPVDLPGMADAYRRVVSASDWVVVEGVGGLLVPVAPQTSVADLAVAFRLPLLIVARPGLGTINHTLLTLEAAKARKLRVLGVVISGYNARQATVAEETNPAMLAELTGLPVAVLPQVEAFSASNAEHLEELGAALATAVKLPHL